MQRRSALAPLVAAAAVAIICVVVATGCLAAQASAAPQSLICHDPDCGRNVTQLIQARGYPVEEYTVQTSDGYLLSVQRIPAGRYNATTPGGGKPVALLWHGLLDASHTWVINFPEQSLGYMLADAGYDVWLANSRGNTYSLRNVDEPVSSDAFWAFSWDEMALIDVPTVIDYVLEQTGQDGLFYVGHSQGTMQAFGGFEDAAVAAKVRLFVALAPVAFLSNVNVWLLRALAKMDVASIVALLGVRDFLPDNTITKALDPIVCGLDPAGCSLLMCAIMGCDTANLNQTRWPVYAGLDPAGTSVQNMIAYQQGVDTGLFQHYDYGSAAANQQHYGQPTPPAWNLTALACDVAIFAGGQDNLADPTDVARLLPLLPPERVVSVQYLPSYSHLDFVWGLNAGQDLYQPVIDLFNARL